MIVFVPVPSRRLGRSLGINNIPPKICTYSCVYCQLGRTKRWKTDKQEFYLPEDILKLVKEKLDKINNIEEPIDYITFVSDGEPTLDVNLGRSIEALQSLGYKIGVISNASLISDKGVQEDLGIANLVSIKVDSVRKKVWSKINRPHKDIHLGSILDGIHEFTANYEGNLITETMLVKGINDDEYHLREIANYLASLNLSTSYLAIPTRPPAESWVKAPDENFINNAYQIFIERLKRVELLLGYEGTAFDFTSNVKEDILSITAVHPMRLDAVQDFLVRAKADWSIIQNMINNNQLIETEYEGKKFYMRRLPKQNLIF